MGSSEQEPNNGRWSDLPTRPAPLQLTSHTVHLSCPSLARADRRRTAGFKSQPAIRIGAHEMLAHGRGARPHARATPTPPHLDVPHMGPITPDLAPRLRAVARAPGDFHHRPHRKSPQRTVPCRYKQPALGSFELSKPAKSGVRRSSRAAARPVVAQLTGSEIPLGLVFRDGRARLYASRGS